MKRSQQHYSNYNQYAFISNKANKGWLIFSVPIAATSSQVIHHLPKSSKLYLAFSQNQPSKAMTISCSLARQYSNHGRIKCQSTDNNTIPLLPSDWRLSTWLAAGNGLVSGRSIFRCWMCLKLPRPFTDQVGGNAFAFNVFASAVSHIIA